MPPDQKKMFSQLSGSSGTLEAAYLILSLKIPARIVRGIFLNEQSRSSQAAQFLEVWCGDSWVMFKPSSGEEQKPKDFLVLQRSGKSLYEISGASNSSLRFSVTKVPRGRSFSEQNQSRRNRQTKAFRFLFVFASRIRAKRFQATYAFATRNPFYSNSPQYNRDTDNGNFYACSDCNGFFRNESCFWAALFLHYPHCGVIDKILAFKA